MTTSRIRFSLLIAFAGALTACGSPTAPGGTESGFVMNGSIRLRWFLDLPVGDGPFPAVAIGAGSGSVSADNSNTIRFARGLNDLGFAVMRYDKRGTGGSDGEVVGVSTANSLSTVPLLGSDMLAVLDQLLTDSRIDLTRVGLFGSSQANWYMPVVADARPVVRFMVVVTGGVLPVGMQNRYEELTRIDGLSQEQAEAVLGLLADFTGPLGFNQIPILERLGIPMLYLLGGADPGGPRGANLAAMEDLFADGVDLEVMVYEGGEHVLPGIDFWPDVTEWLDRKVQD